MRIAESELIINGDGSVFHLHLRPEELADNVILVGDPGRVDMIAEYFEEKESYTEKLRSVSPLGPTGASCLRPPKRLPMPAAITANVVFTRFTLPKNLF